MKAVISRIKFLLLIVFGCVGGLTAVVAADVAGKQSLREDAAAQKAAELLARMSLEEKLQQLLAYKPNGVSRLGIPNLQAGEALHGVVSDGCTAFPQSIALGATFDPDLVGEIAVVIGREARAVGIAQAYAPMLGIARDPRWGRVEECYGEDPLLVSRMAVAYIHGVQGIGEQRFGRENIIATPKHFVADGEPWSGANGEGFETSERVLREVHFPPFEAAIRQARSGSIMPAHHAINGVPCHANPWILQTILRDEWKFDGFVTSDMCDTTKVGTGGGYGGHRVARDDKASCIAALRAGVDMELPGQYFMKELREAVLEGKVPMEVVDRAAARVLRMKILLLGLGQPTATASKQGSNDPGSETHRTIANYQGKDDIWARLIADGKFSTPESGRREDWREVLNNPAHDALALRAARKSVVLLKNQDNLLPLDKTKARRLLVVGPLATEVNLGGYSTGKPKFYITVVDGLKAHLGKDVNIDFSAGCAPLVEQKYGQEIREPADPAQRAAEEADLLMRARRAAAAADVIVAVVGHTRAQLGENLDRDDFDLPGGQQKLVEAMHATGKPVVVVLNGGNVFSVNWIQDHIPAVLQAFYLGQATGTAIAEVLFGAVNPGGKMPMSVPRNVGQSPWYYNHPVFTGPLNYYGSKSGPLYSFGHGLSYTAFQYSDVKVQPQVIRNGQTAVVSATITNVGGREGDEVVQCYIRQDFTSRTRPVKELKGFERITLKPGENGRVSFPIGFEQIKFWKDGRWVAEPGTIQLMLGASSKDIRLITSLEYTEERPKR